MVHVEYLDVSDNQLTDLTLIYMLCDRNETMKDLRVLNMSGNPLKVLIQNSKGSALLEFK